MGRAGWILLVFAAGLWAQARISGFVLDEVTGQPVARAVVVLSTAAPPAMDAVAYSDNRGAFAFPGLPAGKYLLAARHNGYAPNSYGAAPEGNAAQEILILKDGEARPGLKVLLRPLCSISGVVLDPDGDPIPQAQVELLTPGFARGKPTYLPAGSNATDAQGEYRLFNLAPGNYVAMASQRWMVRSGGRVRGAGQMYGVQFYPNSDRLSAASTIALGPGKQLSGIDFHLPLQRVVSITGQVQVPPEASGPFVQIQLYAQDVPQGTQQVQGMGAGPPDYKFSLSNLVPGSYRAVATLQAAEGRAYRGVERFEVGLEPEQQFTISLEPGIELAGRVVVEGDGPGPEPARVELVPGDGLPLSSPPPSARLEPDGSFRLKDVLPGIWDIGVEPIPKGGYIKSMRLGEQDVLTEDMEIDSSTAVPLNIVVSKRGAVVEGKVLSEGAKPVRAVVVLAPEGRFEHVLSFYEMGLADAAGHFEFRGVTPGSYRLYALDRASRFGPQDPNFLKPFRDAGERLELAEGSHISKDVHLIVTGERGR